MAVQYAFGKIVTQGLDLNVDAADPTSYPGTGTSWTSVVNRSITGSLVSCSFSSDFKGGIVFNNPSASVVFPGTVANYGTGSFTIEMAFRPTQIQGIHYLVSKNSGSFPNWGVYLSGSGGQGKLWATYNISSTVSCSVSSSTTFVTGSNYFVDTVFSPTERRTYINIDGGYDAVSAPSVEAGSLTTTGSLFLGNLTVSSSQAYSGSIFNTKVYSTFTVGGTNFKSISPRIGKPLPSRPSTALALIVAGGGGGGALNGGGAGGVLFTSIPLTAGTYTVNVGAGGIGNFSANGSNGQTSSFASLVAIGGGGGGAASVSGNSGGSGGGGSPSGSGTLFQGFDGFNQSGISAGGGGGGAGQKPTSNSFGGSGSFFPLYQSTGYGSPAGWFGGGGGGGRSSGILLILGGIGGGGNGNHDQPPNTPATTGSANTGGGGGAGYYSTGARGGSGIVIIRYPGPPIATGGTITSFQGDTIHTFTTTGSSTFTVF
jgi:hypothetical protein